MQPSCAKGQIWWNCISEGETKEGFPIHVVYPRNITFKYKSGTLIKCILKNITEGKFSLKKLLYNYQEQIEKRKEEIYTDNDVYNMVKDWYIIGMKSELKYKSLTNRNIQVNYLNKNVIPKSIYNYQSQ
jgi:hypothetical protein